MSKNKKEKKYRGCKKERDVKTKQNSMKRK